LPSGEKGQIAGEKWLKVAENAKKRDETAQKRRKTPLKIPQIYQFMTYFKQFFSKKQRAIDMTDPDVLKELDSCIPLIQQGKGTGVWRF